MVNFMDEFDGKSMVNDDYPKMEHQWFMTNYVS